MKYPCKHGVIRYCGICEAPTRSRVRHIPVAIVQPIDFQKLSEAFLKAKWRWYFGYPTPSHLMERVSSGINDVTNKGRQCSNSGGVDIEMENGTPTVKIHPKLALHYKPTA